KLPGAFRAGELFHFGSGPSVVRRSIVLDLQLKVSLGMCADRSLERRRLADIGVAAVGALPDLLLLAGKDLAVGQVLGQGEVALLVLLLDAGHHGEQGGDLVEALLLGLLGHAGVHLGPLLVLAAGSHLQAGGGVGDLAAVQQLEPDLGVLLLVGRGLLKDLGHLDIAFLLGLAGKVGVLVAGLALTGKSFHQIFFGLATLEFHSAFSPLFGNGGSLGLRLRRFN